MENLVGRTLKHYTIENLLGKGGMGIVYIARDTRLERPVALKLLRPDLMTDPDRKSRFLREARSAAALTHPAIAQVYDIDEDSGTTFIAMEFVDGRTVSRLIADRELDLLGAVEIALQVAEGLAAAHEANIIHRDIKSDNIMVTRDGHAKLLDFGLAKLLESGPTEAGKQAQAVRTLTVGHGQTVAGTVMGTINYMSPEQARGQAVDPRSDIFSLGVVLYEMVTGELPFKGDSPLDTMHSIAYEEPKAVTIVRKNLPPQVHRIVARCLRKRREDRYPDARALAADLKRLKHDIESGTNLTLPRGERLWNWMKNLQTSLPFGRYGMFILLALLIVTVILTFTNIRWGSLFGYALIGLLAYRYVRNRKSRMLGSFTKKVAALPEVRGVIIRDNHLTIVTDKTPAKTYLRISILIDSINKKLYFGKPVTYEILDSFGEQEIQSLIRRPGVVYIRDDELRRPGPTS